MKHKVFALLMFVTLAVAVLALPLERIESLPSVCLYKNLTGHDCIGCGQTRAMLHLARGEVEAAVKHNRLSPLVFAAILFSMLSWMRRREGPSISDGSGEESQGV